MKVIVQTALAFSALVCHTLSDAAVLDHIKKLDEKTAVKSIRNIDFIYMINLDERPEKWKASIDRLSPYGIVPCRFSAVNGWKLSLEELDDVGLKFSPGMQGGFLGTCYHPHRNFEPDHETIQYYGQTYFCHCLSRGAIGCTLSHLSVLKDAWDSGYETIWVMEDDIDIRRDPRVLSALIDELDALVGAKNWDVLFTDRDIKDGNGNDVPNYWAGIRPDLYYVPEKNSYATRTGISQNFWKIGARSGSHSMIIRRSGIDKLLRFFTAHQIFFPYDMEYILPLGINLYCIPQDVVTNIPGGISDNGAPNYTEINSKFGFQLRRAATEFESACIAQLIQVEPASLAKERLTLFCKCLQQRRPCLTQIQGAFLPNSQISNYFGIPTATSE
jgi:GR25 family glycosyltransferase involved in LPS biosynthesis